MLLVSTESTTGSIDKPRCQGLIISYCFVICEEGGDIPENRHWFSSLRRNTPRGNYQSIMNTLNIHSLLPPQPYSSDIPPELINFVFDISKDVCGLQLRNDLSDEFTWDRESSIVRYDMEWNVQFVKFALICQLTFRKRIMLYLEISEVSKHKIDTL
jgi:hypothetical protein